MKINMQENQLVACYSNHMNGVPPGRLQIEVFFCSLSKAHRGKGVEREAEDFEGDDEPSRSG